MVKQLSISAIKADFSRVMQRVAHGERIAITKRGKLVAELQPPDRKTRSLQEVRGLLKSAKGRVKVSLDEMSYGQEGKRAQKTKPQIEQESATRLASLGGSEPKLTARSFRRRG